MQYIGFGLLVLGACIGLFSSHIQNFRWMKKLEKKMVNDEKMSKDEENSDGEKASSDEQASSDVYPEDKFLFDGSDGEIEPNDIEDFKMMYSGMSLSIKLAALVIAIFGFIAFFVFSK